MALYTLDDLNGWFGKPVNVTRLYRFVAGRLSARSLHDPEDAVQDIYCRAHRAISSRGGSMDLDNPETWLFTIGCNLAYTHNRTAKRWNTVPISTGDEKDYEDINRSSVILSQDPHDTETLDWKAALAAIEPAAVGMRFNTFMDYMQMRLQGFSYEEIAQAYDVPLGTVKTRIHRGRKELIGRLQEAGVPLEELMGSLQRSGIPLEERL